MPFATLSDTRSHAHAACGSTALSVLRARDETFAHASTREIARAIAIWLKIQRIDRAIYVDGADHPSWTLDVSIIRATPTAEVTASATNNEHLLMCVTGDHPLALGDNLGIEITTAGGDGARNGARSNSIRIVDIADDAALMFALGIRVFDPTDVDRIAWANLAPDVASRVLALTRAWALWL